MDVKKLGCVPDGGGWRAHGRGGRKRKHRIGFDYVHSVVDDHSGWPTARSRPTSKGPTCAGFLRRAAAYFAEHGITRIEQLMTDNAWAYRYSLLSVVPSLGIEQIFIKPHCPWQNGKVEGSTAPCRTEWPAGRSSPPTPIAPQPLRPGSSTTTLNDVTAHSEDYRPPADCDQRGRPGTTRANHRRSAAQRLEQCGIRWLVERQHRMLAAEVFELRGRSSCPVTCSDRAGAGTAAPTGAPRRGRGRPRRRPRPTGC